MSCLPAQPASLPACPRCLPLRLPTVPKLPACLLPAFPALQELGAPTQNPACFCPRALAAGFNFLIKRADLRAPGISCTQYCK